MKHLEKIMKALANRRRLAILQYLKNHRSAPVAEIAQEIDLSFKSTSRHLSVLAAADILEKQQVGLQVFYSLSQKPASAVKAVLALL